MQFYARLFKLHWKLIAASTVVGLIVAILLISVVIRPSYQATAQLFVTSTTKLADSSDLNQSGQFAQQRVKTYADLVSSTRVLGPVIEELGLKESVPSLAARIQTSVPPDTVLISIAVTDTQPGRAAEAANLIAKRLVSEVTVLETSGDVQRPPVAVSIVNSASAPTRPTGQSLPTFAILGLMAGFLLGLGIAAVRDAVSHRPGVVAVESDE